MNRGFKGYRQRLSIAAGGEFNECLAQNYSSIMI